MSEQAAVAEADYLLNVMKKFVFFLAILAITSANERIQAQVSVNINIGSQPIWGPTGYDNAQYYYLPDLDAYYYVPQQQWIYQQNGRWITTTALPAQYRNYDLYSLHKVVINDPQPYLRNQVYKTKYASFRGKHDQQPIRDSHDSRYFVIANHPDHAKYQGNPQANARVSQGQASNRGFQNNPSGRNTNGGQAHRDDHNGQPDRGRGRDRH